MTLQEAKFKIESWCAYQERCQFEVRNKLISFGLSYELIDDLIAGLINDNFINEQRFAESYASGKFRIKNWGKNKIKFKLKSLKISDYSVNKALKEIDNDEYLDTLMELALRKFNELKKTETEYSKKAKIYNYLLSKGYESDLIQDAIKNIFPKG